MRRYNTTDMTEGRPIRLLSAFALPLLAGNLFQQFYNLADSMIVGRLLGADSLAAVGASGSVSFLLFSLFNGISGGCGIMTAQYFGARKDDLVRRAIANSAYIMLAVSILSGAAAFILAPFVLTRLGTPADVLADAVVYMRMTGISVPLAALYNYAASMQRALGDSRTPLYFLIFSCILNVGLDFLFVGAWGLGVFGAALATSAAQMFSGAGALLYARRTNPYFHLGRKHRAFDRTIAAGSLRLGLPLALQWSLIAVSTTALQSVANSFGTAAMAAYTAAGRLEQLVQQPFGSMCMALSTYSGQNKGAGNTDRIRLGFRESLLAAVGMACVMFLVMQMFSDGLIRLFVREEAVIALGSRALKITSLFYMFLGLIYVARGVLNGVGDAFFSFVNGFVEIIGRIGFPLILIRFSSLGIWTIWYSAGLTWALSGLACAARYAWWIRSAMKREKEA